MPVRDRAVEALTRHLEGGLSFNAITDEVHLGPKRGRIVTREYYEAKYDKAFEVLVETIDWNRVLLEAQARHLALGHEGNFYDDDLDSFICGECLAAALLCGETWPEYTT